MLVFTRGFSSWKGRPAELDRVRVNKTRHRANEFEFSTPELFVAVIGKLFYQGIFACHHLGKIKGDVLGANSPDLRMVRQMHDLSRVEKCFRGHAPAKNAKPAHLLTAFD